MTLLIAGTLWLYSLLGMPVETVWDNAKASLFTENMQRAGLLQKVEKPKGVKRRSSYIGRLKEAEKLIEHEYYSLATVEILATIREKPELLKPYLMLGDVYLIIRDTEKLNNLITELKLKFPDRLDVAILEGRKLIMEKRFQEVSKVFKAIGDKLPPELKFYRAVLFALQNDHEGAQNLLKQLNKVGIETNELVVGKSGVEAEETNSKTTISSEFAAKVKDILLVYNNFGFLSEGKNAHLFVLIGKTLAEHNEAVLAQEFADIAIKEDIAYIDAWILRGYSFFLMKNFEAALADFRHAYELDTMRPQTHYFLALTLSETGNNEEAILFFEKALDNGFEFSEEVKWKLVDLFSKEGKHEQVLNLYQDLINGESEQAHIASAIHTAIDVLFRPKVALDFATALVAEKPEDVFALNMHGWALIANKNFLMAEKVLRKAEKINSEDPRTKLNFGLLYESQEQFLKAKEYYKESYELGKEGELVKIANLAADRFNILELKEKKPEEIEANELPENSP